MLTATPRGRPLNTLEGGTPPEGDSILLGALEGCQRGDSGLAVGPIYLYNAIRTNTDWEYSLPRRYRPPNRRRKIKRQPLSGEPVAPSSEGIVAPIPSPPPPPPPPPAPAAFTGERSSEPRHISRDYSYVVSDLRRIALIVAFIIAGLVITAILR